jgi:ribose transport system permease protein
VLIVLVVFFSVFADRFFTFDNIIGIFRQVSILGLFATGMMFVMITGYIDLSIGAIGSFSSIWFGMCVSSNFWNLPPAIGFILTLLFAGAIGLFNGMVITKTKMEPLVGTLATATMLTGVTFTLCKAMPVTGLPKSVLFIGQGFVGSIPVPVILLAVILVIVWFVLNKSYPGRYLYAVGSNSEASRLSGIKTDRVKITAYVITALLAGLAGIVLTSRLNAGQPKAGDSYLMTALISCSVGGISLAGGRGGVFHLICGICVLGVITNGMLIIGFNAYLQNIVQGAVLTLAVSLDYIQRQRSQTI